MGIKRAAMHAFFAVLLMYCGAASARYIQGDPLGVLPDGAPRDGGLNHVYAYVNSSPLRYADSTGLDYWVEDAVAGEAGLGFHQSICVGKRNGRRSCISFGRRGGNCLFNCEGHIYRDRSAPGGVVGGYFRYTNAQTDRWIRNYFNTLVGTRGRWDVVGGENCRDFSQNMFYELNSTFGGAQGIPPQ
jgi:hypothetical protein